MTDLWQISERVHKCAKGLHGEIGRYHQDGSAAGPVDARSHENRGALSIGKAGNRRAAKSRQLASHDFYLEVGFAIQHMQSVAHRPKRRSVALSCIGHAPPRPISGPAQPNFALEPMRWHRRSLPEIPGRRRVSGCCSSLCSYSRQTPWMYKKGPNPLIGIYGNPWRCFYGKAVQ